MLRGEVAALMAAFLWALSTVIFGRLGKSLSPLVLNLAKGCIAISGLAWVQPWVKVATPHLSPGLPKSPYAD